MGGAAGRLINAASATIFCNFDRVSRRIGSKGRRYTSSILPIIASAAFTGNGLDSMKLPCINGRYLRCRARAALQSFLNQAQNRPDRYVRIEVNCDERGSSEYNLALGQRLADAPKKYLENLGLEAERIRAISNGKERPRATGTDEGSLQENRRDDLTPTPGTPSVSSASEPR